MGENLEEVSGTSLQQVELYNWNKALGTHAELIFSNGKEEQHMGQMLQQVKGIGGRCGDGSLIASNFSWSMM